jgi:hypothetical protein
MSRLFATVYVATAALLVGSTAAAAKVVERGTYSATESFVIDDCDFQLNGVSTFSGHFRARADRAAMPSTRLTTTGSGTSSPILRPASGS